ncbi:MAG: hypothetical protein WAO91_02445 [Candidatus Nitrosotenuis sp.]
MDVEYTKSTRQDPSSESGTYADCVISKSTIPCCEGFGEFSKKFPSWSYEKGKFTIVDEITYEGQTQTAIDFCPFCGERIKYFEIKPDGKKVRRKK